MIDFINKIPKGIMETSNAIVTLQDRFAPLEQDVQSISTELLNVNEDISNLNKKSELLFTQINNTNKIVSAYVKEQLFNLEKVRLECKRENLSHIIEEEIMEKRIIWITALPWYKKITKKQQIKLITKMQLIRDEVEEKYKSEMDEVMLEIKNHTRENFFAELNRVTSNLREQKNV